MWYGDVVLYCIWPPFPTFVSVSMSTRYTWKDWEYSFNEIHPLCCWIISPFSLLKHRSGLAISISDSRSSTYLVHRTLWSSVVDRATMKNAKKQAETLDRGLTLWWGTLTFIADIYRLGWVAILTIDGVWVTAVLLCCNFRGWWRTHMYFERGDFSEERILVAGDTLQASSYINK
jgi:hypothetical protein